jgi:hypothetical protein
MIDVSNIFLPHPNPPLIKGSHCVGRVPRLEASGVREPDFLVSPLYKGGLRGVIIRLKSQHITFQTTSQVKSIF